MPVACVLIATQDVSVCLATYDTPVCFVQQYAELYAEDEKAFFQDYAIAHKRLSELGSKFDPPEVGIHAQY